MKSIEGILKSKIDPSISILNDPEYTFGKVCEAMSDHTDQALNEVLKRYYSELTNFLDGSSEKMRTLDEIIADIKREIGINERSERYN